MSPTETSRKDGYLEYPDEAFSYYRTNGIQRVICQEKHMGSRSVVIICRDETAAEKRFGVQNQGVGIVYTRTGRRFFHDAALEQEFLTHIREALDASTFWSEFSTDWVCLDCELMPWSEKAKDLLKTQYAAVGAAGAVSLSAAIESIRSTGNRTDLETGFSLPSASIAREFGIDELLKTCQTRLQAVKQYIAAYRQYCWPVTSVRDLKLAPFHILATESRVHVDKDHEWHMNTIAGDGNICGSSTARNIRWIQT